MKRVELFHLTTLRHNLSAPSQANLLPSESLRENNASLTCREGALPSGRLLRRRHMLTCSLKSKDMSGSCLSFRAETRAERSGSDIRVLALA